MKHSILPPSRNIAEKEETMEKEIKFRELSAPVQIAVVLSYVITALTVIGLFFV